MQNNRTFTQQLPFRLLIWGLLLFYFSAAFAVFTSNGTAWAYGRLFAGMCFFGAFGLFLFQNRFPSQHRTIIYATVALFVYIFTMGFFNYLNLAQYYNVRSTGATAFQSFGLLALGASLLGCSYAELVKIVKWMIGLSVLLFVFTLPFLDVGRVVASGVERNLGLAEMEDHSFYTIQLHLAVLFCVLFPIAQAMRLSSWWRLLATASLGFVVLVMVYYAKRATFVDLTVMLLGYVVFAGFLSSYGGGLRRLRTFFVIGLAAIALGGSMLVFRGGGDAMIDRVLSRFDQFQSTEDYAEFSRVMEVRVLWRDASNFQKIFGYGPISYHISAATGALSSSTHIGWGHLWFKGGPPLVIYTIWLLSRNFLVAFRHRKRASFTIGTITPMVIFISLGHSTVFIGLYAALAFALALYLYPAVSHWEQIEARHHIGGTGMRR